MRDNNKRKKQIIIVLIIMCTKQTKNDTKNKDDCDYLTSKKIDFCIVRDIRKL